MVLSKCNNMLSLSMIRSRSLETSLKSSEAHISTGLFMLATVL